MKDSIREKLQTLVTRHEEIASLLSDPKVISDQNKFRDLSKEYSHLTPIIECFISYDETVKTIEHSTEMLSDADPGVKEMAREELEEAKTAQSDIEHQLQVLLIPEDPNDELNIFLEIRETKMLGFRANKQQAHPRCVD